MEERTYFIKTLNLARTWKVDIIVAKPTRSLNNLHPRKVVIKKYKEITSAAFIETQLMKEIQKLEIKNIVNYYDNITTKTNHYIIMEYCSNGSLYDDIVHRQESNNKYSTNQLVKHFFELGICLSKLHANKIAHRDIKPHNIFITEDGVLKLGDFGEAKKLDEINDSPATIRGTKQYMSPELLYESNEEMISDYHNDVWALGRTFLEMILCCIRPDLNLMPEGVLDSLVLSEGEIQGLPNIMIEIILWMMKRKPGFRFNMMQI